MPLLEPPYRKCHLLGDISIFAAESRMPQWKYASIGNTVNVNITAEIRATAGIGSAANIEIITMHALLFVIYAWI